ncbi:hypothetical protein [Magnetospirillum sp. 15-1]|uniref:hypothetical protein n=1 Tax=Magnetospirillum sp. 15-1 TaxID=1979370 RepID=UPI000BBC05DE|nr:hypothetical protein [Magnetospirillum sp. 15-1]
MTNPLTESNLVWSDVIYAIEGTPKAVRHWMQKEQVRVGVADANGPRRTYSLADAATLAIVRNLVDYGVPVAMAGDIAHQFVGASLLLNYKNTPPEVLCQSLRNRVLLVWRDGDNWQHRTDLAHDMGKTPAPVYLAIDVGSVVGRAIDRALLCSRNPDEVDGIAKLTHTLARLTKETIHAMDESEQRADALRDRSGQAGDLDHG